MELTTIKSIFQIIIYASTFLVLVGTIGVNICTNKIEKLEAIAKTKLEAQRDSALNEANVMQRFYSGIDNPIKNITLAIKLNKKYSAKDFKNLELYVDISPLNTRYEIETLDTNSNFIGYSISEYHRAHKDIDIRNKAKNSRMFVPSNHIDFFDVIYLDLLFSLVVDRNGPKIRDLQDDFFEIKATDDLVEKIDTLQLRINDWIVYQKTSDNIRWQKKTGLPEYITKKGTTELNELLSDRTDANIGGVVFDFQSIKTARAD